MIPPPEITVINYRNQKFKAHPCKRPFTTSDEYQYNPVKQAFTYRIQLPGVLVSLATTDITEGDLRRFVNTGKPIRIHPA